MREIHLSSRVDALRDAAEIVGGIVRLASILDVKPSRVSRWVSGEEAVPLELFLDALDVIAQSPHPGLEKHARSALPARLSSGR